MPAQFAHSALHRKACFAYMSYIIGINRHWFLLFITICVYISHEESFYVGLLYTYLTTYYYQLYAAPEIIISIH